MVDALKKVNSLTELAEVGKAIMGEKNLTSTLPSTPSHNWKCGVRRSKEVVQQPHG